MTEITALKARIVRQTINQMTDTCAEEPFRVDKTRSPAMVRFDGIWPIIDGREIVITISMKDIFTAATKEEAVFITLRYGN